MPTPTQTPSFDTLTLDKVRKSFGRTAVLRGVDTTFSGGRTALLMGPNGAGKSTLLTILSTTSRPSAGTIRFGDTSHVLAEATLRHRIGLLTHAQLLYPDLAIEENLLFFAKLYGLQRPKEVVEAWIAHVQLEHAKDREVRLLSHGMKQRVALGRALMHDPDLVLLDEPFTGLDRQGVELLRSELRRLQQAGKVVIVVTHDVDAVDGLCQQLVVLAKGRVALDHQGEALAAGEILERYHDAI